MIQFRLRFAAVLAATIVVASCAGGGGGGTPPVVTAQLAALRANPALVPDLPGGQQIFMLTVGLRGAKILPEGPPVPLMSSALRLERALQKRRPAPPAYWAIQTDPDGAAVTYWTAVDPTPQVRVALPGTGVEKHETLTVPEMIVALRVPFTPRGLIFFLAPDGRSYGGYRFGPTADAPIAPAEGS